MTNYPQRAKNVDNQRLVNRDVNAATRAVQALKARAQLLTYQEIANQCGYASPSAARKAILREMDRVVVKNVDELRDLELHMLNTMHSEIWQLFMDKNNKGRLFAADRILAISERRSKLMGLDIPIEQAISQNVVVVREVPFQYLGLSEAAKSE